MKVLTDGFRYKGRAYPGGDKPVDLPHDVATMALKEGLAVLPTDAEAEKAKAEAEAKAKAEAENKNLGGAPANK